jgi:hypothetical protein
VLLTSQMAGLQDLVHTAGGKTWSFGQGPLCFCGLGLAPCGWWPWATALSVLSHSGLSPSCLGLCSCWDQLHSLVGEAPCGTWGALHDQGEVAAQAGGTATVSSS